MIRVLLTGATGFLGTQVLGKLLDRGCIVHAVDRRNPSGLGTDGVYRHSINLLDRDASQALMQSVKPDGLIHLAWETAHEKYWNSSTNFQWLASSRFLLEHFARFGGKRAVIAGSSAEYDWKTQVDFDESNGPFGPESLYGN